MFLLDTSCLWYSVEFQTRGVPEVICAQKHITTCMPRHNTKLLLTLPPPPPKNPINTRAPSLGPRLSLFCEVGCEAREGDFQCYHRLADYQYEYHAN